MAVNFSFFHSVQYGNYRNSLSHFFDKKFVKVTSLIKKLLYSQDPNCRVCTAIYFGTKILPTCPNQVPTRLSVFRNLILQMAKIVKNWHLWSNSVLKTRYFSILHGYLVLHANSILRNCAPYMPIQDYTAIRILRVVDLTNFFFNERISRFSTLCNGNLEIKSAFFVKSITFLSNLAKYIYHSKVCHEKKLQNIVELVNQF